MGCWGTWRQGADRKPQSSTLSNYSLLFPLVRRLCPDISFFQRATEYPCLLILDPQNEFETLRKRVEQTTLKSQTVARNRSGVTNVRANLGGPRDACDSPFLLASLGPPATRPMTILPWQFPRESSLGPARGSSGAPSESQASKAGCDGRRERALLGSKGAALASLQRRWLLKSNYVMCDGKT